MLATTASAAMEMSTETMTIMTTEMIEISEMVGGAIDEKMTEMITSFLFVSSIILLTILLTLLWVHHKKEDKKDKENVGWMRWFKYSIVGLISFSILYGCFFYYVNPPKTAGEFGDMYGALNALFSGFAFAVIAYTLHVEMRALKEQRHNAQLQIVDAASFEYLRYMKECEPEEVEDNEKNGGGEESKDKKENIKRSKELIKKFFGDDNLTFDEINELRKNLYCLSAWRRIMSSWFLKVDHFSIEKDEKEEYKKQFWHLLPKGERIASYFQVFLFSSTHQKDVEKMEKLFKSEALIKELIGFQDKKYEILKLLLKEEGKGENKLELNEDIFEAIIKGKRS